MSLWTDLKGWWQDRAQNKLVREYSRIMRRDAKEKAALARLFNNRYMHAERFDKSSNEAVPGSPGACGIPVRQGNRWMCPSCNAIHAPEINSVFSGLIYPACCEFPRSHRWDKMDKIGSLYRPLGMYGPDGLWIRLKRAGLEKLSTHVM